MYLLIRSHLLPENVSPTNITEKYLEELKKTKILMSEWDMNFWIRKTFSHRSSTMVNYKISIEMTFNEYLDSVKHNSIVESWLKKRDTQNFEISYQKTYLTTKCPICLEKIGPFVRIDSCKCIFHEKCINNSVKYSILCPLCNIPIKEKNNKTNAKKKKT